MDSLLSVNSAFRGSRGQFQAVAFVPLFVLITLACAVAASVSFWIDPPGWGSDSTGPSKSKRRFLQGSLLVSLAGVATGIAVHYDFWTSVRYETLRKWRRRPRYKGRQVHTPVSDLKPGFYAVERDPREKENGAERVLHYVWDTQQFHGRLTGTSEKSARPEKA